MKKYLCVLKRSKLFENVDEADIEAMLGCLEAREAHFSEGVYVYTQGQQIDRVSVLAEGRLDYRLEAAHLSVQNAYLLDIVAHRNAAAAVYALGHIARHNGGYIERDLLPFAFKALLGDVHSSRKGLKLAVKGPRAVQAVLRMAGKKQL